MRRATHWAVNPLRGAWSGAGFPCLAEGANWPFAPSWQKMLERVVSVRDTLRARLCSLWGMAL